MKLLRYLPALLLALVLVPLASAATVRPESPNATYSVDPVAANNTDLIKVECLDARQIDVQITGTWVATISFQASNDDSNYNSILAFPIGTVNGAPVTSTTAVGSWTIPVTARWIRIRTTAYTSGTTAGVVVVRDKATDMPTTQVSLGSNQSVNISQINAVTPLMGNGVTGTGSLRVTLASDTSTNTNPLLIGGTGATSIGKAEDAASASGDTGVAIWGIRRDALTTSASAAGDYGEIATDRFGAQLVRSFEKTARSFNATSNVTSLAATPTDVWDLFGNATTTVVVTRLRITGIQTTSGTPEILVIKRSTANTVGTRVAATAVPLDATDSAASSIPGHYTANPTTGTAVGTIRRQYVPIAAAASPLATNGVEFNFGDKGKGVILSGTAQGLCINLNSVTLTGGALTIEADWYEF